MQMLRQLEFSLSAFKMHALYQPNSEKPANYIQDILNDVRAEYSVVKAPEFSRFQHSFSHIFDIHCDSALFEHT